MRSSHDDVAAKRGRQLTYEIRAFKASDKPQILEIARRTWGGHDHLPHVIDKWISDRNSHLYVINHEDRVVSVANLRVIENGRTGWMEGLRVHPRYRKRGLGALMTQHIVKVGLDLGVERLRLTAAMDNRPSLKLARQVGMSERFRMSVMWKGVGAARRWKHKSLSIIRIGSDRALETLQETTALVPENIVSYYWYALDATLDNLRDIETVATFWLGQRDGQVVSLSIGLRAAEGDERVWSCTVYATDLDAFLSNLSHHLKLARRLRIPVLMCIHQVKYDAAYKEVGWLKQGGHRMRLGLFEKHLSGYADPASTS